MSPPDQVGAIPAARRVKRSEHGPSPRASARPRVYRKKVYRECRICPNYQPVPNRRSLFFCIALERRLRLRRAQPPFSVCPPEAQVIIYLNLRRRPCFNCGRPFRPEGPFERYCSPKCRAAVGDPTWLPKIAERSHGDTW